MVVAITGFKLDKQKEVEEAAIMEWDDFACNFSTYEDADKCQVLIANGEGSLGAGESENEFARRLAEAIFKANDGPLKIEVNATYLEDLPCEIFTFDEDDYEEFKEEELF